MQSQLEDVTGFPDTLVLKIIEHDTENYLKDDMTFYVLYDKRSHRYMIRGKRPDLSYGVSDAFAFECEMAHDLVHFIDFSIDSQNKVSLILYNYNDLPFDASEISYEYLKEYENPCNEISGYNYLKYSKKNILSNIRMLKNVFNYY